MTMKNRKTLAAVAVVLLAFCIVFAMPAAASEYYVSPSGTGSSTDSSNPGSLTDVLNTIKSASANTEYTVYLAEGEYTDNYNIVRTASGVNVKLTPVSGVDVTILGTVTIWNEDPGRSEPWCTVEFNGLNFKLNGNNDIAILVPGSGDKVTGHPNPGNIKVVNCNFVGTYNNGDTQNAIKTGSGSQTANLTVTGCKFDNVSHVISGYYGCADEVTISDNEITSAKSAISINNHATTGATITITENDIDAVGYCVRIGNDKSVIDNVVISDNTLTVNGNADEGAVAFRGKSVESILLSKNVISGVDGASLLNFGELTTPVTSDDLSFTGNTWNNVESDYPSSEDCNLGSAIDFFGSGTSDNPYLISSKADLAKLAGKVNGGEDYSGKFFKLTADIDLNNEEWTPIGNAKATPFRGSFNGNSKTISNLKINAPEQVGVGLFGWVTGSKVIENLNLLNVNVTAKSSVGSFVGTTINSYTFKNIHADNVTITGNYKVGGLIGEGYFKAVDCSVGYADSTHRNYVTGNYKEANLEGDAVGGFVGFLGEGAYDALTNCAVYNTEVTGTRKVGGMVGSAFHNNKLNDVSVVDIIVSTNADASYAADNAKTMGVGGLVGLFTLHTNDAGETVGTATITDASITNVKLVDTNNVGASMGYVTGGQRGSDAVETPSEELFTDVDVSVSGTNSGATSSYFVPPTPVVDNTPSSSGGYSEPGAYYNYPRTVTDGGLVEFGTSKVVKSVTLPAGSNGAVLLNIDSIDYWPLAVDSEFTFDISVENLGEGTSYISFKIAESKLSALNITAADIGVYHNVDGEWVKLTVTYKIEEGDVVYTAETDSFSPFKLVVEAGAASPAEEAVTPSEPVTPPTETPDVPGTDLPEIPGVQDEPEEPSSPAPILAVLAGLGAAVVLRRK